MNFCLMKKKKKEAKLYKRFVFVFPLTTTLDYFLRHRLKDQRSRKKPPRRMLFCGRGRLFQEGGEGVYMKNYINRSEVC